LYQDVRSIGAETALLKVLAEILWAVDSGDLAAVLTLLDLSAAFVDTVNHSTLFVYGHHTASETQLLPGLLHTN